MRNVLLVLFCKVASCLVLGWIAAGQLCIFRGSNLNHPHTLQHSWSPALLVPAPPQQFPISNHCHISPISFGNCAGNLVCHRSEKPPWPLFFLERQKFRNFGQILKNCFCLTQSGKFRSVLHFWGVGCRILRQFCGAAFCGNSAEAGATRRFLCRKSPFFGLKKTQKRQILAEKLTWVFRVFCGNSAENSQRSKSISQWSGLHFSAFSARIRGLAGPFPLNSDKFVCSCRLVHFGVATPIPQQKTTQIACFGQNWCALWPICGFLSVWRRASARRSRQLLRFFWNLGRG